MNIEEFHTFLRSTLDNDFKLNCSMHSPPRVEEINALGREIGVLLPRDYLDFLSKYGGAYLEVKPEAWPRPQEFDVVEAWQTRYALIILGIGEGIPDFMNIQVVQEQFQSENEGTRSGNLTPVFRFEGTADWICFDGKGQLMEFSHEEADAPLPVRKTFLTALSDAVKELVRDKNRIRSRRGS